MNPKNVSLQYLWILFGLQLLGLIALLIAFAWGQPRLSTAASNIQRSADKLPAIREQIIVEQNPEILRKDALIFLDGTVSQSKHVQGMLMASIKILGFSSLFLSVLTIWLGVCTYRLHRQDQNGTTFR